MSKDVFILGGKRTPMGEYVGVLKDISAIDLGAVAARGALESTGVKPEEIDHTVIGNALQTSGDAIYGARHVALKAGVPFDRPALTVNRLCGSGIQSIVSGAQMLQLGEAQTCLVGGMESMSQAPHVIRGARSGFASVVTGLLLFGSLVISPLIEVVGLGVDGSYPITAPALVLVGILMMGAVREIDWSDPTEAAPAFLTAVLMPLTFNIAHGLAAGFIVYPLAKAAAGKWREVHPALWGLALLLVLRYALLPL